MAKYEIGIEYGPTAADIHYMIFEASSAEEAAMMGRRWSNNNRMITAVITTVTELVGDDELADILEWTEEEGEAFMRILDNSGDDDGII